MSPAITAPTVRTGARVAVADLFYSFQGEGVNLGRRALFVRLIKCNLTCGYPGMPRAADAPAIGAMVCDTEYTWNTAKHDLHAAPAMSAAEIWNELVRLDPATDNSGMAAVDLVVVSGGEPLLHPGIVVDLARRATASGRALEIETNATIAPSPALIAAGARFNAGLKLASSAVPYGKRIKPQVITQLQASGRARWKFVVTGPEDVREIAGLQQKFGLTEVWLSPEGTSADVVVDRMRWLADVALTHGWNLTTRQHVLIWGDDRGR
ncbi:7-carboxy-7-deazaguanine synthase [Micromonospora qiuiae]|uniref:7-carboxy-7-deazaguanine synthase n=1 Tax=Micromonospora qiuiae TaxID=502268 RepID=A0ABQ4JKG7_9ACTN|nr:7-carboxy-7-deazaguanine synthase QueE [Micromonospora qiuiae]GIJ29992.1 7-carboxy-7-deazaguanine synthase [Micromonospora qiuiae]